MATAPIKSTADEKCAGAENCIPAQPGPLRNAHERAHPKEQSVAIPKRAQPRARIVYSQESNIKIVCATRAIFLASSMPRWSRPSKDILNFRMASLKPMLAFVEYARA